MNRMDTVDYSQVAADILCEFLEVAIHSVLYTQGLYPEGVFQRRKKYNVPVQMVIHPDVKKYIQDAVDSLRPLVYKGDIEQVTLVILSKERYPVQRFVFEIGRTEFSSHGDEQLLVLEECMRSMLLRLTTSVSELAKKPADCSWVLHVQTKASCSSDFQQQQIQDFSWVLTNDGQTEMNKGNIIPLHNIDTPLIKLQLFAEESL